MIQFHEHISLGKKRSRLANSLGNKKATFDVVPTVKWEKEVKDEHCIAIHDTYLDSVTVSIVIYFTIAFFLICGIRPSRERGSLRDDEVKALLNPPDSDE